MSRSATGSRAYFGGPPWWVVVAVPVGLVLALFVLEGVGVPTAPAVLGLFAALYAVFSVVAGVRRGWREALRTVTLPGMAGVVAGAAVMGSGVTVTGVQAPWADDTYLPGLLALVAVMYGLQFLLSRRRGRAPSVQAGRRGGPA